MKVGDYVRTKNGIIGKIIDDNLAQEETRYEIDYNNKLYYSRQIAKSSPNIVDLIEVGDYVNGNKVLAKEENGLLWVFNNDKHDTLYMNKQDIKSIVTKEQFESMKYRIESDSNE